MNALVWVVAFVCIVGVVAMLVYALNSGSQQTAKKGSWTDEIRAQLYDKILRAAHLAAQKCPDNKEVQKLLIEAAQCLVYPNSNSRRIITPADVVERYNKGFAFLKQVESFVDEPI
ncbi:MAG: hypothetical protein K2W82_17270 [Candidatus Obscuribacterales bacterium]|jgi:ABC-type glycerol-3-phosphate transport system permease component|nr:hypothetical protein [Candidatus Obscuribacterales bacterium]